MNNAKEYPVCFSCEREQLIGIIHKPDAHKWSGVLVIVGGPQYRVGSHRQFVLLARKLAESAIPVMRFDYRGMGDSSGEACTFEDIGSDIRLAIDTFMQQVPGLDKIYLWGLCDAATAALLYAVNDSRVAGLVLLNPWVRTESGEAKVYLRHYYLGRLFEKEFWKKMMSGKLNAKASLASFAGMIAKSRNMGQAMREDLPASLPGCFLAGLRAYKGRVCLILSTNDLTANEFRDFFNLSPCRAGLLSEGRVVIYEVAGANHTFSRREWREEVEQLTLGFIR